MTEDETFEGAFVAGIMITFEEIFVTVEFIKALLDDGGTLPEILAFIKIEFIVLVLNDFCEMFNFLDKVVLLIFDLFEFILKCKKFFVLKVILSFKVSCLLLFFIKSVQLYEF